jgi:hypothetical protein
MTDSYPVATVRDALPLPPDPWSIGLYDGSSPLALRPKGDRNAPVITREQVDDVPAAFVADPFMIRRNGLWHVFFEVMHCGRGLGEIGWASGTGHGRWTYQRIVLREPFHLSYPCVFAHKGSVFMVPETLGAGAVRLYRADPFPTCWVPVSDLVHGALADPTPFRHDGRWWMFACPAPATHDALSLFFADRLTGPWREHALSPLVRGDRTRARPAGRVVILDDQPVRFAQDCGSRYGGAVRCFTITRLTPDDYAEEESAASPILGPAGHGWNGKGMHHVDAHRLKSGRWLAVVDGINGADAPSHNVTKA